MSGNSLVQGVGASTFQAVVARVLQPELLSRGYEMDPVSPAYDVEGSVFFEKKLQQGIFLLVTVQPNGIFPANIYEFAINLIRNDPGYRKYRGWQTMIPGYFLGERLASALWISDRQNLEWESDHWWSFRNEEKLEMVCREALGKLLKYGIPYLEDLTTKSLRLQD